VFEDNLIDTFYPERPAELENVCLYDYVRHYDRCGKDSAGRQKCFKLSKPCLPNHRLYDPNKEGQREDYFYALILLFTPFRNEDNLIGETETAEEAFKRLLCANSNLFTHHEKLQNILAANRNVAKIAEAREEEQKIDTHGDNENDNELEVTGEAKDTMKDVQDLQGHLTDLWACRSIGSSICSGVHEFVMGSSQDDPHHAGCSLNTQDKAHYRPSDTQAHLIPDQPTIM